MDRCAVFRFSFILLASMLLAACAGKTTVVLLPDPDGTTGGVTVSNEAGTVAMDTANEATSVSGRQGAPKDPAPMSQEEIEKTFSQAVDAQPEPPVHFILYFVSDSNELRLDSRKMLPDILRTIENRHSVDISVIGHTDTVGSKEYNFNLSKKRAESVAGYLIANGVEANSISVTSHGEGNPLIPTGDNVSEPRNRRVEVVVR